MDRSLTRPALITQTCFPLLQHAVHPGHAFEGSPRPSGRLQHLHVLMVRRMCHLPAVALGPEIRVNVVAPGFVETPWTAQWEGLRKEVQEWAPLHRVGTPQEIAEVVLGLLRSTYVTGQIVIADGGFHLRS
jgi:hypothetical protein